jgi:predicted nucleic acid-binding Zn ribbon protein
MTMPLGSVRTPKLWVPLLRSLNIEEKKRWDDWERRGLTCFEPVTRPEPYGEPDRCRQCGRRFYPARRYTGRLYCSDKCAGEVAKAKRASLNAVIVRERSLARAKARAGRKCIACGKPIKAKRSTKRFCSSDCRVAVHRGKAQ